MTTRPQPAFRILLVDNHRAVREALAALLEGEGLVVCAQVGTRAEALACVGVDAPDLAVVDLSLGEENGLPLIADLSARDLPVVVCSAHEGPAHVSRALEAGARAYVAKREAGQVLTHVIQKVLAGWMLVTPQATGEQQEER